MFMGPCIVIILWYINPNKTHKSQSLFNVYGSVHRNNIVVYKSQQDAQVYLMFMGPCIVIILWYINPNKMHKSQSLFNP